MTLTFQGHDIISHVAILSSYAISYWWNIPGPRPWFFRVTWHHRSHDQFIPQVPFPIGASMYSSLYLQPFLADRTNRRAYATVLRLSVVVCRRLSVCDAMYCG